MPGEGPLGTDAARHDEAAHLWLRLADELESLEAVLRRVGEARAEGELASVAILRVHELTPLCLCGAARSRRHRLLEFGVYL